MLDSFSKRLKCCRVAADLTSKEIVSYIENNGGVLSIQSYARWEKGTSSPIKKPNELEMIVDLFSQKGVRTTSDWMLYNEGVAPQFLLPSNLSDGELFTLSAQQLKARGWKLKQITGSYGFPHVGIGEMVILSEPIENFSKCHMKLGLIQAKGEYTGIIDVLNDKEIIVIGKGDVKINRDDIVSARLIKWIKKI